MCFPLIPSMTLLSVKILLFPYHFKIPIPSVQEYLLVYFLIPDSDESVPQSDWCPHCHATHLFPLVPGRSDAISTPLAASAWGGKFQAQDAEAFSFSLLFSSHVKSVSYLPRRSRWGSDEPENERWGRGGGNVTQES